MTTPEELYKLEQGVVERSVGPWKRDVEEVKKQILIKIAGADTSDLSVLVPEIMALLETLNVPVGMGEEALQGVLEAHAFGKEVVANAVDGEQPKILVSKNSKDAVGSLRIGAESALQEAKDNLSRGLIGKGAQSILTAVAPVLQNPAKSEAAITWAVNNASNSAVSKLSLKMGETMTWISERNGCVHCMAYSGKRSTKTGFPEDLTFGAKPLAVQGTLPHPPLHPHCRCTVEPGITDDYAAALERESIRSVLKGFKLPSESDKVRIEAAKRLLDTDPVAPESVKKYAKKSIKDFEAEKALKAKPILADSIEGKDFRSMTNAEKLRAAEAMYGKNSKQYRDAQKRFGKK